MKRRHYSYLLLALLLLGTILPFAGSAAAPVAEDSLRFGVVEAFWSPEQAAALGVDWERILFYWSEIQPEGPDSWNTLHVLQEWLDEAQVQDRQIVGLIKHTPAWATDGTPHSGVPRGLELPVDDPNNLWASYVRKLARYYGEQGVHHWIIWNEPDIEPGVYGNEWEGTVAEYYRLLKVAYLVMKEEDPQATIHLAGLTYWHDVEAQRKQYLRRLLEVATADPDAAAHDYFFDTLSLHIYFRVDTVPEIVAEMDKIQQDFGLDKPIWINETNAAPTMDPEWPVERPQFQVDLEQQAWYIVQAHALAFAAGVESVGIYKFSDVLEAPGTESFGLVRADFSERPAYHAHQAVIEYLRGFETVERERAAHYEQVTFTGPERTTRVIWARDQQQLTLSLPAVAGEALLVEATGETQIIPAGGGAYTLTLDGARCYDACIIGGPPLLLVEEGVQSRPWSEPILVGENPVTPPWELHPRRFTALALLVAAAIAGVFFLLLLLKLRRVVRDRAR